MSDDSAGAIPIRLLFAILMAGQGGNKPRSAKLIWLFMSRGGVVCCQIDQRMAIIL
jgi:hypothetical protein